MTLVHWFQSTVKIGVFISSLLLATAYAQNPVPQVVGPPNPQAVKPGSGDFTLKVYGANFVPGAVVNWNRQPRATKYVSGHEIDAQILASDVITNTAGYIMVTNPGTRDWTVIASLHATLIIDIFGI